MKISKQQLENMIREELQKEVQEGFFGGMAKKLTGDIKGAASSGIKKVAQYGKDVAKAGKIDAARDRLKKAKHFEEKARQNIEVAEGKVAEAQQEFEAAQEMVALAEDALELLGVNPRETEPMTDDEFLSSAGTVDVPPESKKSLPENKKKTLKKNPTRQKS